MYSLEYEDVIGLKKEVVRMSGFSFKDFNKNEMNSDLFQRLVKNMQSGLSDNYNVNQIRLVKGMVSSLSFHVNSRGILKKRCLIDDISAPIGFSSQLLDLIFLLRSKE